MTGLTPGPRRTDHEYEKTDRFLLIGGAVLVLLGLGLAADSWLSPSGKAPDAPAFAQSADSARARFLRRDTTPAPDSTATPIPVIGPTDSSAAAVPDSGATAAPSAATPAPAPAAAPTATPTPTVPAPSTPTPATASAPDAASTQWIVQAGAFGARENADKLAATLDSLGYRTRIIKTGSLHRVQALAFPNRTEAKAAQARIAELTGARAVLIPPGS